GIVSLSNCDSPDRDAVYCEEMETGGRIRAGLRRSGGGFAGRDVASALAHVSKIPGGDQQRDGGRNGAQAPRNPAPSDAELSGIFFRRRRWVDLAMDTAGIDGFKFGRPDGVGGMEAVVV